jgi:O-antigen ligase
MAGVLLAALGRWAFPTLRRVQRSTGMILILSALLVFAAGKIYKMAALSGIMGEDEYRKYSLQSKSKIGLLSGRTEVVTGLMAIGDSPILGHGSWPWDEKQYRRQTMEMIGALDMLDEYMTRVRQLGVFEYIPTHSHFVQAWVWHGFLGGVFWIYVLIFLFRFFCDGIHLYRPLLAWFAIVYLSAIWALIFSPISSRFSWGVLISVAALGLAEAERRRRMRLAGIPLDPDAPWDGRPSASPFA